MNPKRRNKAVKPTEDEKLVESMFMEQIGIYGDIAEQEEPLENFLEVELIESDDNLEIDVQVRIS